MGRFFLVQFLSLLSMQGAAPDEGTCFPGDRQTVSPAKGYQISYRWQDDLHHVFFERSRTAEPIKLLTFERSVCVHWSLSGDFFALTNYAGSNISVVEIVSSDDLEKRVRVSELLPPAVRQLTPGSLHGYAEALSWDRDGLIVRVHGERQTEPREFDLRLRCRFERAQWSCSTTP